MSAGWGRIIGRGDSGIYYQHLGGRWRLDTNYTTVFGAKTDTSITHTVNGTANEISVSGSPLRHSSSGSITLSLPSPVWNFPTDTTLRVRRIYADQTNNFTDLTALGTFYWADTSAHSGYYKAIDARILSRGDSGLTATGAIAQYLACIEDTTGGVGNPSRKRGVIFGQVINIAPYTENAPYTTKRDEDGLLISNVGNYRATTAIYIGGSRHLHSTATNTDSTQWRRLIEVDDTANTYFLMNGGANIGLDLSGTAWVGSNPRAIKTASTIQSDLGTLTLGGATLDSTLSITGGERLSGGLNISSGKLNQAYTETALSDAIGITALTQANPSATSNKLYRNFFGARITSGNAQTFNGAITLIGLDYDARHQGTGTVGQIIAARGQAINTSSGTVTEAMSIYARTSNTGSTGTIQTGYGVFIDTTIRTGAVTNSYGLYQKGLTDSNYFAGPIRMSGNLTGSATMRGSDSFTTTATTDTVTVSGGATSDFYFIQLTGTAAPAAADAVTVEALVGKFVLHRSASGTSGLTYNWFRIK